MKNKWPEVRQYVDWLVSDNYTAKFQRKIIKRLEGQEEQLKLGIATLETELAKKQGELQHVELQLIDKRTGMPVSDYYAKIRKFDRARFIKELLLIVLLIPIIAILGIEGINLMKPYASPIFQAIYALTLFIGGAGFGSIYVISRFSDRMYDRDRKDLNEQMERVASLPSEDETTGEQMVLSEIMERGGR